MQNRILLIILAVALLLRIYKLDKFPVSISWDEAAIGYNAYSVAKTGADEYGAKLPLLFKSFNDYKLPGYIYVDSQIVNFLGLNPFTVRLPSAIFGTFAVLLIFFIAKELFSDSRNSSTVGLLSSGLMAVSPWHLQFSRAAFEANTSLTVFLLGVLLLLKGLKSKTFALISIPVFVLSLYFYYSARVVLPLFIISFFIVFRIVKNKHLKYYLLSFLIGIFVALPIAIKSFSYEGAKRITQVSILGDTSLIGDYVLSKSQHPGILSTMFLNQRIPVAFEFFHNYIANLSLGFFFFGDDPNPRHKSAYHGLFYMIELPILFIGIYKLFKLKDKKTKYLLIAWLLMSPIPASLAKESPHGLRSLLSLPPMLIVISMGLSQILNQKKLKLLIIFAYVISFVNYFYSYYVIYPLKFNQSWAYGYQQTFEYLKINEKNYDRVVFTGYAWKPYIFYLFYNKVEPSSYQAIHNQQDIGKYFFENAAWDGGKNLTDEEIEKLKGTKTLVVASPQETAQLSKTHFKSIYTVMDYAKLNSVFILGEWQ